MFTFILLIDKSRNMSVMKNHVISKKKIFFYEFIYTHQRLHALSF